MCNLDEVKRAMQPNTSLVWIESPTNPYAATPTALPSFALPSALTSATLAATLTATAVTSSAFTSAPIATQGSNPPG